MNSGGSKTKVLILHPSDTLPTRLSRSHYDLILDLGRAPLATYERWRLQAGCPVTSIYDFVKQEEDLRLVKTLMQRGNGVVDDMGIDWWSVLSPSVVPWLRQLILTHRASKSIHGECDLYSSRRDYRSDALHLLLGGRLTNLEGSFQAGARRLRHYSEVFSKLDLKQILQITQDKFDGEHSIRRRCAKRRPISDRPLIVLPSAYINVSRTALSYAASSPEEQFLLVCARNNARVRDLPANVQMISLDSYFTAPKPGEIAALLNLWNGVKSRLIASAPEYESAASVGLLDRIPALIRWGITIRDAWSHLFESVNVRACFSADHNNPYTGIPLLLARHAGIPAVACHHGALDSGMAITTHDADFYVAKTEMERDYMTRVCGIAEEKVIDIAPGCRSNAALPSSDLRTKAWLVFFSEPYDVSSWRTHEVYAELLPYLSSLAENCGLELVFKLHPFETIAGHRNLLRRLVPAGKLRQIEIIAGPIDEKLWNNVRFAVTVESSVALECASRGIPIFLCGWLQDSFTGYVRQYERFGVGYVLKAAAQLAGIPHLLESRPLEFNAHPTLLCPVAPEVLHDLLAGGLPSQPQVAARG